MPIEMKQEEGWTYVRVAGTLVKQDYTQFEPEFRRVTGGHDHLKLLLDMTELKGWEPAAFWEEIKFDMQHMGRVKRLAVLGSKHWQHAMTSFADAFVSAEIKYFEAGEEQAAKAWLKQG